MTERTPVTDNEEVWIHGRPFRVMRSEVGREMTNVFGRKVNQGDPGPDDHPSFSTSIQTAWDGGGLVKNMNPAADTNRFHKSSAETQYPGALALGPKTFEYAAPNGEPGTPYVIGDFVDRLYVVWADSLYTLDQQTDEWTFISYITGVPAGAIDGTVYREQSASSPKALLMFFPTNVGYTVVSETNAVSMGVGDGFVVDFEIWDDKLFALRTDGTLWWTTRNPTVTTDWNFSGAIPDGSVPRRLLAFVDKQGEPCLFIVTNHTTWKHDFANTMLHKDDLHYPKHPYMGKAAINHRNEVWTSVGTGVFRFDNNTISPQGLDSRDGLDPEYRGFIADFESAQPGLYALVQGAVIADDPLSNSAMMEAGPGGLGLDVRPVKANNSVYLWNGFGWHHRWHGLGDAPTNIKLSNVQNVYRIYWGANGKLFSQIMPWVYFNPADLDTAGYPFAPFAEHESSWNAWGWKGQDKILKMIELEVDKLSDGARIEVYYKIDHDKNPWNPAGVITENGEHRHIVGIVAGEPALRGGAPHTKGVRHEQYKLMFRIYQGSDEETTPIIKWHSAISRRWLRPQRVWTLTLDLTAKVKDWPIEEQIQHLDDISTTQESVVFQHQEDQFIVDLIMLGVRQKTGRDHSATATVTLIDAIGLNRFGVI